MIHMIHRTHDTHNTTQSTQHMIHITHDTHNTHHIIHRYTTHYTLHSTHYTQIHTQHNYTHHRLEACAKYDKEATLTSPHILSQFLANLSIISIIGAVDTQINIGHLNLVFIVSDSISLSIINIFDSSTFYWLALT